MKKLFLIIFILLVANINVAENFNFVTAQNGLRLRENPDINSKVIRTIPNNEEVILIEEKKDDVTFENITGRWTKIKYSTREGWVFGGFLGNNEDKVAMKSEKATFTVNTKIKDVISNSVFGDYGRLLFPVDEGYYSGDTLEKLSLTWYGNINPNRTVEIANFMKKHAEAGDTVFYDIYSKKEKVQDSDKKDTGLFFFRGNIGAKTAIVNAGGGFAFVGAMHDSFPHALELSKKGYNAFALIYRPGANTGCEDLARAIAFLHKNAAKIGIDMKNYSLWGGSAGARLAAWLGSHGTESFGEDMHPRPAAVIMEYTGLSEVTGKEPPTYACVGTDDGIASYKTMQNRIDRIKANGTAAEIEIFQGLSHGFGLGEGTVAEGWIDHAASFWERQM